MWRGERADVEYVRILHPATTMEATVDSCAVVAAEAGESFDYAEVRDLPSPGARSQLGSGLGSRT